MFRPFDHQHEREWNAAAENTDNFYTACNAALMYTYRYITTKQCEYIYIYIY
jgi:hypothetical protein